MHAPETPYRVIVMGKTGSGKSSLLNALTNTDHFKVGSSIMSETKEVQSYCGKFRANVDSPDIVFIDTPGFFDSSSKDNKIIAKIALSLHKIGDGVNLVLFCFPAYEIRLDASMQASWKFLKLIMGSAVYEHVVIVLTHGSRLTPQELEGSVARMTTEFIPYLRNTLRCKVKEEILIFKKDCEDDGLEEVLNYILENEKYKPEVMQDLGKFWDPKNPLSSLEALLKNSATFGKIQGLLLEVQDRNESMQGQLRQIRHEMKHLNSNVERETRKDLGRLAHSVNTKIRAGKESVEALREQMHSQMKAMQQKLSEKNKQIDTLWKELHELKTGSKLYDSLTTRATASETEKEEERHGKYSYRDPDGLVPLGKEYAKGYYPIERHRKKREQIKKQEADSIPAHDPASSRSEVSGMKILSTEATATYETERVKHKKEFNDAYELRYQPSFETAYKNLYPLTRDPEIKERKKVGKEYSREKCYMNPVYVSRFSKLPCDNPLAADTKKANPPSERRPQQIVFNNAVLDPRSQRFNALVNSQHPKLKKTSQGSSRKSVKAHAHSKQAKNCVYK